MLVQSFEMSQALLENGQFLCAMHPLTRRIGALFCKSAYLVLCHVAHHFMAEQGRQLLEKAGFNGENAKIVDKPF